MGKLSIRFKTRNLYIISLLSLLSLIAQPAFSEYILTVGDYVIIRETPQGYMGYISNVAPLLVDPHIEFVKNEDNSATLRVKSYFDYTATVKLVFLETYINNGSPYVRQIEQTVSIRCKYVRPTKITLPESFTVPLNGQRVLEYKLEPEGASLTGVSWTKYNGTAAFANVSVDGGCRITGRKVGEGSVTVTVNEDENLSATCRIIIVDPENMPPTKVKIPEYKCISVGGHVTLYPELEPENASASYTWYSDNENVAKVSYGKVMGVAIGSANITVKTNNYLTARCRIDVAQVGPDDESDDENELTGTIDGHEYVDLGLSVKWATCNVGASSPEQAGNHYAWGETVTKSSYSWDNYSFLITPFPNIQIRDIGSDIKGTEYDAAYKSWGKKWRMPSETELKELYSKCTVQKDNVNGVDGLRFTGPNGQSIFMPVAGVWGPNGTFYPKQFGYWSSNHHGTYNAKDLYYTVSSWGDVSCSIGISMQASGESIRPVSTFDGGFEDGDIFTAKTSEGVEMKFQVISASQKTCSVYGNYSVQYSPYSVTFKENCIDKAYTGAVTIPETVKGFKVDYIAGAAFAECKVSSVTIPSSVSIIRPFAFAKCSNLTSISIPNSVEYVNNDAFRECTSLKSVKLSNSLKALQLNVFCKCSSLNSVTIPSSVTEIDDAAFQDCSSLTSIIIPSSVTTIGSSAFYYCSSLSSIIVDSNNKTYDSRDNCNAIIEKATNNLITGCMNTVIPSTVTSIERNAFCGHQNLSSITLPKSITAIGGWAFYNCKGLKTVNSLIETPFQIEDNVFQNWDKATQSYLPPTATLYVPKGTKSKYQQTAGWKLFTNIVESGGAAQEKLSLTASPSGGNVSSGTKVYLTASSNSSTVSGANIYYTLNGSTPTTSSTKYTSSGITITQSCTLKAIAYKEGYETSSVLTASYTVNSTTSGIAINSTNFPDTNFRNYLLSQSYGTDGKLTEDEIKGITKINVYDENISSLKGIEHFTALTYLDCYDNQLTALDVSKNTALTELYCGANQLTALDVSKNTALTDLSCYANQLTTLDVSKNTALTDLSCFDNQLTTLDISKNTALSYLSCDANQLTTLDISKNTALTSLDCSKNQLTSLNVSKNIALTYLRCHNNKLTSLDVSKNANLERLICYSNNIKKSEMEKLINSLPSFSTDSWGRFYPISFDDGEKNVCTKSQVAKAKAKGWKVYDSKTYDYEGSEDVVTPQTINMSSAGYATFYSSESAYTLPGGLSAQVVTGASNSKLMYKTIADGSVAGVVPKSTAVMLVSDSKRAGSFTLTPSESTTTYSGTNLLRGSDEATTTTGDGYHYKLSYGKAGSALSSVFGWYWGSANGGAFQIDGHKAWLVIPKSSAARGYSIEGETLGVGSISFEDEADDVYYDLQGRRVSKPTVKGVYIKNGKKVTIK